MPKKFVFAALLLLMLGGCGAQKETSNQGSESVSVLEGAPETTENSEIAVFRETRPDLQVPESDFYSSSDRTADRDSRSETKEGESDHPYFGFRRTTHTDFSPDGIALMTENRCYLDYHTEDQKTQEWVDQLMEQDQQLFDSTSRNLTQYAEEIIAENGTDFFYTYSNYQDHAIVRQDQRLVSIVTVSHVHSGGPHPNTVQTARNLDLQERRVLRLEDVIREDCTQRLEDMVQERVRERFEPLGVTALYEEYPEIITKSMQYGEMTPYWYFDTQGLTIFYNQYELGPYAAGIIKVDLPYDSLEDILRPEYAPQPYDGPDSDLAILDALKDRKPIPLVIEPDGPEMVIGTNGEIREVQVSEVFWVDQTPVTQTMLISIRSMDDGQALVLTGGFDDRNRSFAVEFLDENDEVQTYYIYDDKLNPKPVNPQ